jgi:glycosyltransferase involved in cell wall biosynthesis
LIKSLEHLPISAIIVARNAESTILDCLASLQRNEPAEIIVVDGNSTDKTVEIARRYTGKIYFDKGRGPSYAHQLGAEMASQQYIAYIDSDIILPEGTLKTLLADLEDSDYISMEATIKSVKLDTYWERAVDWNASQSPLHGGLTTVVIRKNIVLKYRFDESIKPAGDDYDFKLRMEHQGFKVGNSKRAVAYHYHRVDFKSFIKQRFRNGCGKPRLIRKYGPWNARFWPPLIMFYWFYVSLIRCKPSFILYFIADGILETAGLLKGVVDLMKDK